MKDIIEKTEALMKATQEAKERFAHGERPTKDRDFFMLVKAETDLTFNILDEWVALTMASSETNELALYPQQIEATKENMQSLLLHSYYKDTRKRRFMEIYKSCYYIFAQLLKETEEDD